VFPPILLNSVPLMYHVTDSFICAYFACVYLCASSCLASEKTLENKTTTQCFQSLCHVKYIGPVLYTYWCTVPHYVTLLCVSSKVFFPSLPSSPYLASPVATPLGTVLILDHSFGTDHLILDTSNFSDSSSYVQG
jgi:hypothetical protein